MFIKHASFKLLIILFFLIFLSRDACAQFTPGSLVVLRVGNGSTTLSSAAARVDLVEYTTSGSATGYSITLPASVSGSNRILTQSGSASSEGDLTLSANKQYLVLCGYDASASTSTVATSGNYNGVIGRIDPSGNVNTATYFLRTSGNAYVNDNYRSVCSKDGTAYWASGNSSGSNGGVRYISHGTAGSAGTQVSTTITNTRTVNIFNNQLYVTSSSSSYRMSTVGSGLPTSISNTITNLSGMPTASFDPYAFVFLDADTSVSGVDLCYIAALGGTGVAGLYKYSFNGSTWTARGSASGNCRGLTAMFNCAGKVDIYVTVSSSSGAKPTALHKITDTAAFNATISASTLGTAIATSGTNYAFGGVAFAPEKNVTISSNQSISAGTYSKIKILNGGVATFTGNVNITDSLVVYGKGTLDCGNYVLSSVTNFPAKFILMDSGILKIGKAEGITQSAASGNIQTCRRVYSGAAHFEYSGATAQLTGNGLPAQVYSLKVKNSQGVTLTNSIIIAGKITFASGLIKTTYSKIVKLKDPVVVSPAGGLSNSFISGPMDWEILNTVERLFPLGKDTIRGKCALGPYQADARGTPSRTYRCEFIDLGYANYSIDTLQTTPLDHVSKLEYWLISEQTGASGTNDDVYVKLYWTAHSGVGTTAAIRQELVVAHFDSAKWKHEGSSPAITDNGMADGYVLSDRVTSLSPFTLGSLTDLNPLPVNLISFNAQCGANGNKIVWQVVNRENIKGYVLEKLCENIFCPLATLPFDPGVNGSMQYEFTDNGANEDQTYRLLEVSLSGEQKELTLNETHCSQGRKELVKVFQTEQAIIIKTDKYTGKLNFILCNGIGQVVLHDEFYNNYTLSKVFLTPGVYVLYIPELQVVLKLVN